MILGRVLQFSTTSMYNNMQLFARMAHEWKTSSFYDLYK